MRNEVLIEVRNLKKYFPIFGGILKKVVAEVHAVDDIGFDIMKGEVMGLVGESGCGKTTAGRTILRLIEPTAGKVFFESKNIFELEGKELKEIRRNMQIIFQDPFSSLNPRKTAKDIIGMPLKIHGIPNVDDAVADLMEKVGLNPDEQIGRYPHEFSGGERQRLAIARALALNPGFVVADEPVSALDVSIRAEVLHLMKELQKEFGLSYLFITHDLSVAKYMCDRIAVMYLGMIFELAKSKELFAHPINPYTEALLSAVPIPDPTVRREKIILTGEVPTPINPPPGCRFHTRCPYRIKKCEEEAPEMIDVGGGHFVACHVKRG